MKQVKTLIIAAGIFLVAAAGCSKDSGSDSATLQVRLTDAPAMLQEVNVDIREVRVNFSDDSLNTGGWLALATIPGVYNLLALQNGVDTLLATGVFPANSVKEIRFILGPSNTVKENGVVYPLIVPGGSESGLKIKVNKSLNAGINTLVIDFDAGLSVKKEGNGDFKLRPVLRVK